MHIDSHYAATLGDHSQFEPLSTDITTQTCVIGGGFAGLTTARELVKKGHDVVVLEAEQVGFGASGRNGGFVSSGFARSLTSISKVVGWENTQKLYALSKQGRDYVFKTIHELDRKEIILGKGWLKLLRHADDGTFAALQSLMADKFDIELEMIPKSNLDDYVKSDRYFAGLHDPAPFHIQPLQYANALAADIDLRGGKIYENSRCVEISRQPATKGRWHLSTSNGSVSAEHVVLATSTYGGPFERLNRAMVPITTYVVSSKPDAELLNEYIPFTGAISDMRRAGDYYRAIGNGDQRRLIWGGRITTMRTQPKRLKALLMADIASNYPKLASLEIERAWSGLMGYAVHKMPIIGQMEEGLWAATAFGGHGLSTTAMAGMLISNAIADGDDTYQLFEHFGPEWVGGYAGKVATQLEYWRLQYLDRRDEK